MVNLNKRYRYSLILISILSIFLFASCEKLSMTESPQVKANDTESAEKIEDTYTDIEMFIIQLESGEAGRHMSEEDKEIIIGELEEIVSKYKVMIHTGVTDGQQIREIEESLNKISKKFPSENYEANVMNTIEAKTKSTYEVITGNEWGSWNFSESFLESGYEDRGWTIFAQEGSVNWVYTSYGAKMSAYQSGEDSNIAWLISPKLEISDGSQMSFESAQAYPDSNEETELKVLISKNYDEDVTNANWNEIDAHLATSEDGNWSYVESGTIDLSQYAGESVNIAFKYIGSKTLSTAFEVKNLEVNNASIMKNKVEDPVFSPGSGTYTTTPQSITLSSDTQGATIYYTLDGSVPTTNSNEYTGPIEITESTAIKSIAVKDGIEDSEIITATYTISDDPYGIPVGYYDNIGEETGEALKAALNDIIDGHTELTYDQAYDALEVTDRDPNNESNVILLYTGWSMDGSAQYDGGNGWNREHVWAKSHGDFGKVPAAGTDIHHLRPTDVTVNSARGNKEFDNGGDIYVDGDRTTECKSDSDSWEPRDEVKGDVARMIFYMATRYEGENGDPDLEIIENINDATENPTHGKLSVLLEWNTQDPVSEWERRRNHIIYTEYQNNRNPFIDHPEWVDNIWGN